MNFLKIIKTTGAIASISAWVMAYIQWNGEDQIKSLIAAITGIILGIIAIWAHRTKSKSKVDMSFETLSDELYIEPQPAAKMLVPERNKYVYNVNYPRLFKYLPNLKVECTRGKAEIRILEETENHFKIKAIRSTFPIMKKIKIRWVAKGKFIN